MNQPPLMLSVSGLRGLIGSSLTPAVAARFASAFGQWLKDHHPSTPAPLVVIGRDSRPSGPMIEMAAASGLLSVGCRVTSLGIATTPAVAIMAEHLHAHGGMVVTASHNPIQWNGLKTLRHDGAAPPPDEAADIIRRFNTDDYKPAAVNDLFPLVYDDSASATHIRRVLAHIDVPAIRKRRLKVVLDSVHGAGGPSTALLLKELGVELIHLYAEPTGRFPHTPEPTKENLTGLADAVKEHHADIGFAQDPDADRLAVVDDRGVYIGEEYTLALGAWHVLEKENSKQQATAKKEKPVAVANLSTSRMIDDVAAKAGAAVIRTPVGEANVAAAMKKHRALVGGEGNGGIIWPRVIYIRDSLSGIALFLEMLAHREQKLSQIVAQTPAYAIVKDKADLRPDMAARLAPVLKQKFAGQKIDLQDGVRIDWPDRWVHVRTSNTEPIIRVIAEARDEKTARDLIADVRAAIGL